MAIEWQRGRNPYRHNYFGRLGVGADTTHKQTVNRSLDLVKKLEAGAELLLDGVPLDVAMIQEAQAALRKPETRAEQLLLVHASHPELRSDADQPRAELEALIRLPDARSPLDLVHAGALYALLPRLPPIDLPAPPIEALGVEPVGGDADIALDIVLDE
jgi:hypothetical protein